MADYDVITIGGGHTGLITSTLLAKEGKKVLCVELNDRVGGLASNANDIPGYTHNRGAWFLMFANLGWLWNELELDKYNLELMQPKNCGVALAGPGRKPFRLYTDQNEHFAHLEEDFGKEAVQSYIEYYKFLEPFGRAMGMAMKNPPISIGQMMSTMPSTQAKDAMRRIFYGDLYSLINEFFPDKEKTAAIRGALMMTGTDGFFGGPMTPGSALTAAYHAMTPEEGQGGAPYRVPKGHMGKFSEAIAESFKDKGGELRLNTDVQKIIIRNGAAVGIKLASGEEITANTIVSSLDTYNTFINLVGADLCEPFFVRQIKNINYQEHLPQMYLALKKLPEFAPEYNELNKDGWNFWVNLWNPDLYEANWDDCKHGRIPERIAGSGMYIPSMLDPSLAPPGKHSATFCSCFAWPLGVPAEKVEETKKIVSERWIDSYNDVMPGFWDCVEDYKLNAPPDLERQYRVTGGTWTHGMVEIKQMFDFRPVVGMSDYKAPFKNLYLCGTSNHPGPGITGCSPVNCYNVMKEDEKNEKKKK